VDSSLEETTHADPQMVDRIVKAMALGMQTAIIPGSTTQADLLSAVFTVLYRMLETSKRGESKEERQKNAEEIGRVLGDMLMAFGAQPTKH
jgi:hypothetical protein